MSFRALLLAAASLSAMGAAEARAQAAKTGDTAVPEVVVTSQRLDAARLSIQPSLGASTYTVTNESIAALPGGEEQPLNQVVLQMPGVVQDGFGQLHIRDDHNNIQYRLNGVILPEGISVFGQTLSPRPRRLDEPDHRGHAGPVRPAHRRRAGHLDQERPVPERRRGVDLWRQLRRLPAQLRIRRIVRRDQCVRLRQLQAQPARHRQPRRQLDPRPRPHRPGPGPSSTSTTS